MHAWLGKSVLKTLSVHALSTIVHAVKKLSENCEADEGKDYGSDTEQDVASTLQ